MARFFTLRQAQELLPHVRSWLEEAASAKADLEEVESSLQALAAHITMAGGMEINPVEVVKKKASRQMFAEIAQSAVDSIQKAGCILKDLDQGLVDFPALLDGKEVYLCWKRGEERIEYWHRVEDGFAGRQPIGLEFDDTDAGQRPN